MTRNILLLSFFIIFTSGCTGVIGDYEEPDYKLVKSYGDIEIREYKPYIVAEVTVEGDRGDAVSKGFRPLGGYIFGDNIAKKDIDMTVPVAQEEVSEKIEMTAPVSQEQVEDKIWKITFKMPEIYQEISQLPKPINDDVKFRKVKPHKAAVIKFSGRHTDENFAQNTEKLISFLNDNKIKHSGILRYAYYNPPWTLWFLRRNEVMVEIN